MKSCNAPIPGRLPARRALDAAKQVLGCALTMVAAMIVIAGVAKSASAGDTQRSLEQRRAIASNEEYRLPAAPLNQARGITDFTDALDIAPSLVLDSHFEGPSQAAATVPNLGVIDPRWGDDFLILSTGIAGSSAPEPGVDFGAEGPDGDRVFLTIDLQVPEGSNLLSFDHNFLSAEFPDFVGPQFNDTFVAVVRDSSGIREIVRDTVSDALFSPVSESSAGGSGFDIFTEDPSDVDTSFGRGFPDAGLTGFSTASITVPGGEAIALHFSIEDRGDGILDSTVIIDNVVFTGLEIVDPNPDLIAAGSVTTDAEALASWGDVRRGAAADGVTQVVLRAASPSLGGEVEFCIVDGVLPDDGSLSTIGGKEEKKCVKSPVESTSLGPHSFAVYTVPENFTRPGNADDEAAGSRPLRFEATYKPLSGDMTTSGADFTLVRPPLVLVHGLWSDRSTWGFPMATDARFSVTLANYKSTNASFFADNAWVLPKYVQVATKKLREEGLAATQVDVGGHSMGGLLTRNHVSSHDYLRDDNFMMGDVNKLLTLNTPHFGSPLANILVLIHHALVASPAGGRVLSLLQKAGMPIDKGAPDDLSVGSSAIDAIGRTRIPAHALFGTGGSDVFFVVFPNVPGEVGTLLRTIGFFVSLDELFEGIQHDLIVGRKSQEGGMPENATTHFGGLGSIHTKCTTDAEYSNCAITRYNAQVDDAAFAEFPALASPRSVAMPLQPKLKFRPISQQNRGVIVEGVLIVAPFEGQSVLAGDSVLVSVEPEVGVDVAEVLILGPNVAETDSTAPFSIDIVIPLAATGTFPISVVGRDASGGLIMGNTVNLSVLPDAALEGLTILPRDTLLFGIGDTETLTVIGDYSDGVPRDLNPASTELEFMTSDESVVSVTSDGLLTALEPGAASIVAKLGSIQNSIRVNVVIPNVPPIANAGEDIQRFAASTVTLDGRGSSDPDAGPQPLTHSWLQLAGPSVALSNATAVRPSFSAILAGEYVFGLVVSDGYTDSLPDSVSVRVIDQECMPGDCNQNGQLDAGDPTCILLCAEENGPPGADCSCSADCDCAGGVDGGDPFCAILRTLGIFEPETCAFPTTSTTMAPTTTTTTTTTTSMTTTTTLGEQNSYLVTWSLVEDIQLGALQWTTDYSGAPGAFGRKEDPSSPGATVANCDSPDPKILAAFHDGAHSHSPPTKTLSVGTVDKGTANPSSGFGGAGSPIMFCFFVGSVPSPSDFPTIVTNAVDPDLEPIDPFPTLGVSVLPWSGSTTTTLPGPRRLTTSSRAEQFARFEFKADSKPTISSSTTTMTSSSTTTTTIGG